MEQGGAEDPLATFGRFVLCSGAVGQHPSAGREGFSWCRSFISSRRKQSSGIKELCAITHSLSELLPQYGRARPNAVDQRNEACGKRKTLIRCLNPVLKGVVATEKYSMGY